MSRIHGLWLSSMFISMFSFGQTEYKKDPAIGVHFFLNDFKSASNLRSSSLNSVLINKKFGKVKEMTAGLALNYLRGLNNHFDFSLTGAGSFVSYELRNNPGTAATDRFLLEVDASIIGKLMPDKYWVTPYVQTGVGGLIYGPYYGAFIPAGAGLQVNFYDEAFLLLNAQYRIPVTETANYHFYYSLGIAGNIGKKKDATTLKSIPPLPIVMK